MPVKNRIAELQPEIAAWRRDFHENPELLYEVHRTVGVVAEKLRSFGVDDIVTGIGRTGVVATIKGRQDTAGRVIGLRADVDALPIQEITGLPYASKTPGVMHACGHDGHTAMLLGAAKYLAETRNFDGTAVLIFQPAEEGGAGAREMCEDGLMARWNIQEVYGMHNWPGVPLGQFAIRPGPFFAATNQFTIQIEGKGGHAAKPHDTIDPTVVGAQMVMALQSIVSRNADPLDSIVVSVTSFRTGSRPITSSRKPPSCAGRCARFSKRPAPLRRNASPRLSRISRPPSVRRRPCAIPKAIRSWSTMIWKPNMPSRSQARLPASP